MPRHRPRDHPRWLWPLSWLLCGLALACLIIMPARWWDAIWPAGRLRSRDAGRPSLAVLRLVDVEVIAPPADVTVVPDPPEQAEPPPPSREPDWWSRAWEVRVARDLVRDPVGPPDTLALAPLLELWGAGASVELILAQPDSVVDARLWQLVNEDALSRNDLSGLYSAIARGRAYVDMKRREAAMFDEFGRDQIRVPD